MAEKKKATWKRRRPLSRRTRNLIQTLAILMVLAAVVGNRLISSNDRGKPAGSPAASAKADDLERFDKQNVRVREVIDGDTLDLDMPDGENPFTRVRLWGVDTPETRHPDLGEMYYGPEASRFTKDCVEGKTVCVCLEPQEHSRDRYGRLLAYIYLPDGQMLNQELVEQGFGYADPRFRHIFRKRFEDLEKQAAKEKRGLWKEVRPDQFPPWRIKRESRKQNK